MRFPTLLVLLAFSLIPGLPGGARIAKAHEPQSEGKTRPVSDAWPIRCSQPASRLVWHPKHISDATININFACADLGPVLTLLAEQAGLRLVLAPLGSRRSVTIHLRQETFDYAFHMLVESFDLDYFVIRAGKHSDAGLYVGYSDQLRVPFHEAGHAIICRLVVGDHVAAVSVFPDDTITGHMVAVPARGRHRLSRKNLINKIRTMLGGIVAEEMVFGDASPRANNDLCKARYLARMVVGGFSAHEGRFSGRSCGESADKRNGLQSLRVLRQCRRDVELALLRQRNLLELLTVRLLEARKMDAAQVDLVLQAR